KLVLALQFRDDLGRKKMRIDDDVPGLLAEKLEKPAEVHTLDEAAELVGFLPRRRLAIEQIIKVAEHVRQLVRQVEIGLTINAAEDCVGELKHVDVLNRRLRVEFFHRQLDSLSRPQVPRSNRRGKDQNA